MYANGVGVLKDEVEAMAWYNIGAASGSDRAAKNRASLEGQLGSQAALAAQQRAKEILNEIEAAKTRQAAPGSSPTATGVTAAEPKSSGSGVIVSAQGYVLTAAHVVAGADSIRVLTAEGTQTATVLRIDAANDVAVLKISGGPYSPLPIAPSRRVRLGQAVATIGFPNIGFQGFSPKVTRGEISSVNGFNDDPRSWQISVPVQPGNSGGPLLDENGNLIGVVVAKLGLKAAAVTGDMPQNVNYAVKSAYALPLLEPYLGADAPEPGQPSPKPAFEDMVSKAQQSVVLILCY
jgi:S1-C subfamily serine protease